ncbi:MAG: penicillin acylase family protein, partial [Actinomycetota bacterium]|nr:penicillin acylase family protein [Actinomycetota bacterium]
MAGAAALVLATSASAVGAPPDPKPYRADDAGGFLNIIPPGQNGHASAADVAAFLTAGTRPPNASDQLRTYADLVFASPGLRPAQLGDFFKDASFGVPQGQEASRYSPRDDVTIQRDRACAVPHVYGTTRAGTMFGAGYVGAEDRLFLMDVLRHVGRAELSSFVGGSQGNRQLDREQWAIAPYTEADLQRQFEQLDDLFGADGRTVQDDVRNYVAGINRYIAEATAMAAPTPNSKNGLTPAQKLPGEYAAITPNGDTGVGRPEPFVPADLVATASLVGGIFGKGGGREVDSSLVLLAARAKFGAEAGRKVFDDFRNAEDPEAPTTIAQPFPYQAPPEKVDERSVAVPDPASVEEAKIVARAGRR